MSKRSLGTLALAVAASGSLHAVEINQTLFGELLVEGINQNNYTDANGEDYVYTNPNIYQNLNTLTTVGNTQFLGGLQVDPDTFRLITRAQDTNTFYQDRSSQMWIRAKLGAKIELEDRVEANLSVVYDAEGGDQSQNGAPGTTDGRVYFNDANVLIKRLILPEIHLRVGRQPVSWNLRRNYGGFLYDSRADNPKVTSWDGIRGYYTFDTFTFSPFYYIIDENREERGLQVPGIGNVSATANSKDNTVAGLHIDWQPEVFFGDNKIFLTGSLSVEHNPIVERANSVTGKAAVIGEDLLNWYLGFEAELGSGFTLYAEGAFQEGKFNQFKEFSGQAFSAGVEWEVGGVNNAIVGLQVDHQTGDRRASTSFLNQAFNSNSLVGQAFGLSTIDKIFLANLFENDPNDREYNNFVAPHEGVSDALIVEHERYGELSELLVGNLAAVKLRAEYRFDVIDPNRPIHMKFLWSYFLLDTPGYDPISDQAESNYFGNEFDLNISWQYSKFTTISLFGGAFLPGLGYRQVAADAYPQSRYLPAEVREYQYLDQALNGGPSTLSTYYDNLYPNLTGDDAILLGGINVHVTF